MRVTFRRRNKNNGETTQKTTQKILELMRHTPTISTGEIAEVCGLTRDGVNYNIRKLKTKGIIRREGGRKGGHWEVVEYETE